MSPVRWYADAIDPADRWSGEPLALCLDIRSEAAQAMLARGMIDAADRREFAGRGDAAYRLARRGLARALVAWAAGVHPATVRFGRTDHGAPVIAHPPGWHVSLAGRDPWCLIGLAREPIGVDLEPATAGPPPLDLLTPAERCRVDALPPEQAGHLALTMWAAKEAHGKRLGAASRLEPEQIEVGADRVCSASGCSRFSLAPRTDVVAVTCLAAMPDS